MATTPTLHTFDPLIAGKVGLFIDSPTSYDIVIWLASKAPTSGMSQVGTTNPNATDGLDGLSFIVDGGPPGSVTYWTAKLHDSAGYGSPSAVVTATASAGPPPPPVPPTKLQELEDAVGSTLAPGDQVALYLQPAAKVLTVQTDGSLA